MVFVVGGVGLFDYALSVYKGIPVTLIVLVVLMLIYGTVQNRGRLRRLQQAPLRWSLAATGQARCLPAAE